MVKKQPPKAERWDKITSNLEHRNAILLSTSEVAYVSRLSLIYFIEGLLLIAKKEKKKTISLNHLKKELKENVQIIKSTLER